MDEKEKNEAQEEVVETSDETKNEEAEENFTSEDDTNHSVEENEEKENFTSETKPKRTKAEKLAYALEQKKKWEAIAERYTKETEKEEQNQSEPSFTLKETTAINQAINEGKLAVEDIDELVNYARYKNISVIDAIKDPVFQTIVEKNMEHRQAVRASNTDKSGSQQEELTLESFVSAFKAGKIDTIEPGSKEAELMYEARRKKLI